MSNNNDQFYTTKEVAAILKLKESTIQRWLRDGILIGCKANHVWRVRESQLQEFVKIHQRRQ